MFKKLLLAAGLLLQAINPSVGRAQTHVFPATDTHNTFTGQQDFNGGVTINGAPGVAVKTIAGTGAPSDPCSSTQNIGLIEVNSTPVSYQCTNATGVYQWNISGGALPAGNPNSIQTKNGSALNGGLGTLDPATGKANLSVNTLINVQMYGAKGDCSTNDTAAVAAAQTAAEAYASSTSLPATLFFPKPSGGCYIVSNLTWHGVSMEGPSSSLGPAAQPAQAMVTLQSLPGQDILHVPDPTTTSGTITVYPGWSIQNINFQVNDTSSGSFPHRWPGRWFDDGAMLGPVTATFTNGSAVISGTNSYTAGSLVQLTTTGSLPTGFSTATNYYVSATGLSGTQFELSTTLGGAVITAGSAGSGTQTSVSFGFSSAVAGITCGDVGEPIKVTGAGPGGTDLVTTIASVSPCWTSNANWQRVNLAAAASTAVTNAHSYISVLGLPVTTNIGNCAIAFDLKDGNPANWVGTLNTGNYGKMSDVTFNHMTQNYTANDCAIYTQGNPVLYGFDARNVNFYGEAFSVVQGSTELNSFLQPSSGDFETWDHQAFLFVEFPWISYNGLAQKFSQIQVTAAAGFQVLQLGNNAFDTASGWEFGGGMESPNSPSVWGFRVNGSAHRWYGGLSSGASGQIGYWDVADGMIEGSMTNVHLAGSGNRVRSIGGPPANFVNNGMGNNVEIGFAASYWNSEPYNYKVSAIPNKGIEPIGILTPDSGVAGNAATPYSYRDLMLLPLDFLTDHTQPWETFLQPDTSSPTGYYIAIPAGTKYNQWNQFTSVGNFSNSIVLGTNLPATATTVILVAKCLSGTQFIAQVSAFGGTAVNQTLSCSTSYQTYTFNVTWAGGDVGKFVQVGSGTGAGQGTIDAAYWQLVPAFNLPVGSTVGGNSIPSGPSSGTAANDLACYANTTGLMQDCNSGTGPNLILSGNSFFTIKSTTAGARVITNGATGQQSFHNYQLNGTSLWNTGVNTGANNFVLFDGVSSRTLLSFPSNTMPANSMGGNTTGVTLLTLQSITNCASSASPAVCSSAPSGSVVVAAAATTVTVNTTAVTANSQIQLTEDSSLGTRLGVTCNTTPATAPPTVSARVAATSFTITTTAPTTNPRCFSYTIVN